MDVTPALLARERCLQEGQLVRFFGRTVSEAKETRNILRIEDLLDSTKSIRLTLADACLVPDLAAIVRVTGPWLRDGTVEAYAMEMVEDTETLRNLQNRELLRLLDFQSTSAYKIARSRIRKGIPR